MISSGCCYGGGVAASAARLWPDWTGLGLEVHATTNWNYIRHHPFEYDIPNSPFLPATTSDPQGKDSDHEVSQ